MTKYTPLQQAQLLKTYKVHSFTSERYSNITHQRCTVYIAKSPPRPWKAKKNIGRCDLGKNNKNGQGKRENLKEKSRQRKSKGKIEVKTGQINAEGTKRKAQKDAREVIIFMFDLISMGGGMVFKPINVKNPATQHKQT
jgi:hypothetical protein